MFDLGGCAREGDEYEPEAFDIDALLRGVDVELMKE